MSSIRGRIVRRETGKTYIEVVRVILDMYLRLLAFIRSRARAGASALENSVGNRKEQSGGGKATGD